MKKVRLWPIVLSALLLWSLFGSAGMAAAEPTDSVGEATPEISIEPSMEVVEPTPDPTLDPALETTPEPSTAPAIGPSGEPSPEPTLEPTLEPTIEPSADPDLEPIIEPTLEPSPETTEPTPEPSPESTLEPVFTPEPTSEPTGEPSPEPSVEPLLMAAPMSLAVSPPTTLSIHFCNLLLQDINITNNPLVITIPPDYFRWYEVVKYYDFSSYVPDVVVDLNGNTWDAVPLQLKGCLITKGANNTYYSYTKRPDFTATISNSITGDPAPADTVFTFEISNAYYSTTVQITGADSKTVTLPHGTYNVEELGPPDDYTITSGNNKEVGPWPMSTTASFTNNYTQPKGSIQITKIYTGVTPHTGDVFTFTAYNSSNTAVGSATITAPGTAATISGLPIGSYTVKEAPVTYYTPDAASKPATVTTGGTTPVSFTNNYDPRGSIAITKSYSGVTPHTGDVFTFTAYNSSNTAVGSATITAPGTAATISGLPIGSYTVKEAPVTYYTPDAASKPATVTTGGTTPVSFANDYQPRVIIRAIVYETGTTTPLPGAQVELAKIVGGVETDHFTDTTDAAGIAEFSVLPGDYKLRQQTPPAGYHPNTTEFDISLPTPGSVEEKIFYNNIILATVNTITLSSHDGTTPLAGARFSLFRGAGITGTLETTFMTDALGQFSVPNLYPGTYTLLQTAPPAGYYMDPIASTVGVTLTVGPGDIGEFSIQNTPKPSTAVVVLKASDANKRLSGVQFSLYKGSVSAANFLGNGLTDRAGNIIFGGLAPGAYIFVQETVYPGYYKASNTSFSLGADGYIDVLIFDDPEVEARIPAGPVRGGATPTPTPSPSPTPTPIPSSPVVTIAVTEPPYGPATGEQSGLLIAAGILMVTGTALLLIRRKILLKNAR